MADIDRRELYKQFQDAFPIESLKEMTLEKYTNLNRDDSFCYWLESRTYTLGSFWGGSSFKFGIYKYAKPPKTPDRYAVFDNNYAWYNKYKKNTPQEAFEVVKEAIVSIAEHARKGELESIDKIDVLGEAYKWKIAFLYSNESLIPIYKREMLNIISAELGMNEPKKKSVPYIQRFLLLKKGDNDLYEYYDELLSILNRNNAQNTFATLKKVIKEKLKSDLNFKVTKSATNFLWIGTKDGKLNDPECHYEFCSDNDKTANHEKGKVYVELHCEDTNAKKFKLLEHIDGAYSFPWKYYGIRMNNEGWSITDYTTEELSDILIEELYKLDELIGDEVMNIINSLNKSEIESTKYAEYINLLENCHNLVLTGAPGTGKTYMAREIAKNMEAETMFVQFHPSYDYTDFVEGLRPVDSDNNQIGFKRKNGIFKDLCKKAVENIINSQKTKQEIIEEKTLEEKYNEVLDKIENGEINDFTLKTKKKIEVVKISDFNNIILRTPETSSDRTYTVSFDRIAKLAKQYTNSNSLNAITNINKAIRNTIGGCNASAYWAVLNEVYKQGGIIAKEELTEVKKKKYVLIIDEINRGEASKIFGELFFAIDPGYRVSEDMFKDIDNITKVQTQYQNLVSEGDVFAKGFYVPDNVYILATMNDIDRSVESMDFAMRRRFTWKEVTPDDTESMLDTLTCAVEAKSAMKRLNKVIAETDGLGTAFSIGPSYFLKLEKNGGSFDKLWKMNIEPLLKEYLRGFRQAETIRKKFEKAYFNTQEETSEIAEQTE